MNAHTAMKERAEVQSLLGDVSGTLRKMPGMYVTSMLFCLGHVTGSWQRRRANVHFRDRGGYDSRALQLQQTHSRAFAARFARLLSRCELLSFDHARLTDIIDQQTWTTR